MFEVPALDEETKLEIIFSRCLRQFRQIRNEKRQKIYEDLEVLISSGIIHNSNSSREKLRYIGQVSALRLE